MKDSNSNFEYLKLIIESIDSVYLYLGDNDKENFLRNNFLKDAILMRLIVIGEYGAKITNELKERFNEVEWQQMKAARNFYIHVYGQINYEHVWEVIEIDLKPLKVKLENILAFEIGKSKENIK